LFGLCKDGRQIPVDIGINPLEVGGQLLVLSSVTDVTERQERIARLNALNAELENRVLARTVELRERDAMLHEIHHRVKNNLQVISSLINMQVRTISEATTRSALQKCRARVETMAEIHAMLYASKDYARIPFSKYARQLAMRVMRAAEADSSGIRIAFDLEEIFLTVDSAIPCGLILNELLSNARNHAFPNAREGAIRVELKKSPERRIALTVSDDGIGMPADFEAETVQSLGLQLVLHLARQLDGHIERGSGPGTRVTITFATESPAS
jgi:two-component sensor histidine kinase